MRLLFLSHLFKFLYVNGLLTTHPLQHRDVCRLFLPHLFETANMLIGPFGLVLEHGYVGLETLVDFALSLDLSLNCAQML